MEPLVLARQRNLMTVHKLYECFYILKLQFIVLHCNTFIYCASWLLSPSDVTKKLQGVITQTDANGNFVNSLPPPVRIAYARPILKGFV